MKKTVFALLGVCLSITAAQAIDPPDVVRQARGAKKVIVATAMAVEATFGKNEFGDRLIFSHVTFRVNETMKGVPEASLVVTLEGGTVDGVTLQVSDMPGVTPGERAVLFLDESAAGRHVPHGRGAGVLKLDKDDRIVGSMLTLENVRASVKRAETAGGGR